MKDINVGIEDVMITHLQFSADTKFFLNRDVDGFFIVLSLLTVFEKISGLTLNMPKSGLASIHLHPSIVAHFASQDSVVFWSGMYCI